LQNTLNKNDKNIWTNKQEVLIEQLKLLPLIIVLRIRSEDFENSLKKNKLFELIQSLYYSGIRHIEIAWSPKPKWKEVMREIKSDFKEVHLGASSITSKDALNTVIELELPYAMSPVWDESIQSYAKNNNQVLVPGVFSPTEINKASKFGYRLVKLFPASILGSNYLKIIQNPMNSLPFIIAAGGLKVDDLNCWMENGCGAVILGGKLTKKEQANGLLNNWIKANKKY